MSSTQLRSTAPQVKGRPHLHVRLYKAAYLLLTVLTVAACSTSMPREAVPSHQALTSHEACYWPQSWGSGCREMIE